MNRRAWLAGSLGLLAGPASAAGQAPAKAYRIGLLGGSPPDSPEASHLWRAFFDGLRDLGYVEGRNLVVEGRFYGNSTERLPALAEELARLRVDVIAVGASPAPEVTSRVTSTIPIVLTNYTDPVESGLAASLARPGGNVTGPSLAGVPLRSKQLQLLRDVVPRLDRVAVLSSSAVPTNARVLKALGAAARSLKVELHVVDARTPGDLPGAFAEAKKNRAGALVVIGGSMFFAHRARIVELAATHRLPAAYGVSEYVEAGGLLAYAASIRESFRRAAGYVDRILKGARPGDLPIEQPTTFELVINLKTAKALGLSIPPPVLAAATRLLE